MRIVCPVCSATYEVRDELLVPGRAVRCARCNEQWVPVETPGSAPPAQVGELPTPDAAQARSAADPPPLTAMDRLASQPAQVPRASNRLPAAWAASVALLLLLAWGAVTWRADLMHAWPPSTRLYGAFGLAPAAQPER